MHGNPQAIAALRVQELRRQGGRWLREKRERANLSQRQLAAKVGAEYYTLVSQLETGRGRVPPDDYVVWAEALNISPEEFARTMMRFYDPVTYNILFEDTGSAGKH
jgi:transcriptional regulator with XRE-family HTH domain